MTLNITVFEVGAFHQSADFRLLDADTGRVASVSSPKQIILDYGTWGGVLTYAGVGRLGRRETSDWVLDTFAQAGADIGLDDATELLADRGAEWLASAGRPVAHTFTLAAFRSGSPIFSVISNVEDVHSRRETISAALQVNSERAGRLWVRSAQAGSPVVRKARATAAVRLVTPSFS